MSPLNILENHCVIDNHLNKGRVIALERNTLVMHEHTLTFMLLNTEKYNYRQIFSKIGVTDNSIDACFLYATKLLNEQIK